MEGDAGHGVPFRPTDHGRASPPSASFVATLALLLLLDVRLLLALLALLALPALAVTGLLLVLLLVGHDSSLLLGIRPVVVTKALPTLESRFRAALDSSRDLWRPGSTPPAERLVRCKPCRRFAGTVASTRVRRP
jgi:hypothetical protein